MAKRRSRRAEDGERGGRARPRRSMHFQRRTAPGASPGEIVPPADAPPPRMRLIVYGPGGAGPPGAEGEGGVEHEVRTPAEIGPILEAARAERGRTGAGGGVVWLNIDGLGNAAVIAEIGRLFGLHRLALEDVVNVHQRAKVEPYGGDQVFIVLREAEYHGRLETDQISMFLGRTGGSLSGEGIGRWDFVVSFQEREGDSFDPLRRRIRTCRGRVCSAGADYLAYAMLDAVIDGYFPVLEQYGERLEALEEETMSRPGRGTVQKIHAIKRDLLTLRRAVWPAREAVSALIRDPHPLITDDTRLHLRDCYDHLVQLIDMLETYRETGGDLMDVYLSSVSHRLNEVIKVLTIISTIFMPLSFLAGVYGMNFDRGASPYNMPELGWRYGYPAVLAAMAAVAAVMLVFFWRRGWLGDWDNEERAGADADRGGDSEGATAGPRRSGP